MRKNLRKEKKINKMHTLAFIENMKQKYRFQKQNVS